MKKSLMVSGMNFGMEFLTNLYKEVVKKGGTEETIFEAFKTDSGLIPKIAEMIVGTGNKDKKSQNEFLRLISGNESLVLDSADGKEILADAKEIFAYIDPDFIKYGADEEGSSTKETPVAVYELVKDTAFSQMFGSLSSDLNNLCLTQAQIKSFAKNYRNWLRTDGYATFFLFKSHNQFFVAIVLVSSVVRLRVRVFRFEDSGVWCAGLRHRLVVPQLA